MRKLSFQELLATRWSLGNFLCVGLDSELIRIPTHIRSEFPKPTDAVVEFNEKIIEATHSFVCAYKINPNFYIYSGGYEALVKTMAFIKNFVPGVPIILDCKFADVDYTSRVFATSIFSRFEVDAITVNPYLGRVSLTPLLKRKNKGIFIVCHTSNKGAAEFQKLEIARQPFYSHVASSVANNWNQDKNCGLVVSGKNPKILEEIRAIANNLPFLIPGIGSQGGNLLDAVKAGKTRTNRGVIITISRDIIFASRDKNFLESANLKATHYRDCIQKYIL